MEFAIGQFLDLKQQNGSIFRWQNFWINETISGYSFVPFGFSGLTTNRQGDNIDATLVFPNNELSRQWALSSIQGKWLAQVQVILFNPENKTQQNSLFTYVGQITNGAWDETAINIRLNTLIDAVGGEVPARRLTQKIVGNIPTSANIQLF